MADHNKQLDPSRRPANDLDEIPVEELIRMTRQFTRRIDNQDRKRLGQELRESGHQRTLRISAPVTLQQFFAGEIDLDTDLSRRFANAPLLSTIKFFPKSGEMVRHQASALISSNDDQAMLSVDAHLDDDSTLDFTFTLYSALALRFRISPLTEAVRRRWLDLMRRKDGITFLWTRDRWETAHVIFVVRENFVRVYAFSPHGIESAARLTPDMATALLHWLEDLWFPGQRAEREAAEVAAEVVDAFGEDAPDGDFAEIPTHMRRPRPTLHDMVPDAPEEQWAEPEPAAPTPAPTDYQMDVAPPSPAPEPADVDAEPASEENYEDDLAADDLDW